MGDFTRLVTTSVVWVVCGVVAIMAMIFGEGNIGGSIPVIGITMGVALVSTLAMWVGDDKSAKSASKAVYEKAKRGADGKDSRLETLLALMSEDEREAFKETLKQRVLNDMRRSDLSGDGELPSSLADLLDEERPKRLR